MEWLMGKARGVGRGLIGNSSSSPNCTAITVSASNSESVPSTLVSTSPSPPPYLKSSFLRQQLSLSVAGNTPVDFPFLVEPEHPLEKNEWIAVHTIGLVENLCSIFDPLYEMCLCRSSGSSSLRSAESDSISESSEFLFTSSTKPIRQVISLMLSECNDAIQSARIFPVKQGEAFSPSDLREEASRICRKLLPCLVHIYTSHVHHLEQLDLVAHMNTIAKHFFAFTTRFELLQEEGEDNKAFAALHGFHKMLMETPAPNAMSCSGSAASGVGSSTSAPSGSGEKDITTEQQIKSLLPTSTPSVLKNTVDAQEQPAG